MKFLNNAYLPDREDLLLRDIVGSPQLYGGGTVHYKKLDRALREVRVFGHAIDIGANIGLWSRVLARRFKFVSAFEPNPETEEAFWANVHHPDENHGQVVYHRCALGAHDGLVRLNNTLRSTAFTRVQEDGALLAKMHRLDTFVDRFGKVDFIKIDVEGFEYEVVRGAVETINRNKPVIIIEQTAEMNGGRFAAMRLLQKWGARTVVEIGGDYIMKWS